MTTKLSDELVAILASIPAEFERTNLVLAAGLVDTHNGTRLQGARYVVAGRPLVWGGSGRLVGWSLRAVTGAVSVTLRDSRDTSGDIVAVLELPAGVSATQPMPGGGVSFTEGLNATVTGPGVLEGAYWLGAVD